MKKIIISLISLFSIFLFTACGGGDERPDGPHGPDDHEHWPGDPDGFEEFTITIDNDNGDDLITYQVPRGKYINLTEPHKKGFVFSHFINVNTNERVPMDFEAYTNMNIKAIYEAKYSIQGELNGKPFTFYYENNHNIFNIDWSQLGMGEDVDLVDFKVYKDGVLVEPEKEHVIPVSPIYTIKVEAYRRGPSGILYDLNENNEAIVVKTGYNDVIYIPEEIDGHKVTEVKDNFYKEKNSSNELLPTTIIFPKTLKSLQDNLLKELNRIHLIYLPKELSSIGNDVFNENVDIDLIIYGGSEQELNNISKGSNIPSKEDSKYVYNREINNVDYIDNEKYSYIKVDSDIILDFRNDNKELTEFDYHSICANPLFFGLSPFAFDGANYTSIILPDVVTDLPRFSFHETRNLKQFTFPKEVKSIGAHAFNGSHVKEIVTSEKLESIDVDAFYDVDIQSLNLEKEVKFIDYRAFDGFDVEKFVVHPENTTFSYSDKNNILVNKPEHKIIWGGANPIISDDIKIIGKHAFYYRSCENIDLSFNNVEVIEDEAFIGCNGLNRLFLTNVKTIGKDVFTSSGVKEISFYPSLTSVDSSSLKPFYDTKAHFLDGGNNIYEFKNNCLMTKKDKKVIRGFKDCSIPSDAVIIGAFAYENSEMEEVVFPEGLTTVEESGLNNAIDGHFKPNKNLKYLGKNAINFMTSKDIILIPDGVETLDDNAINISPLNMRILYLPASLKEIKGQPFLLPGSYDEVKKFIHYGGSEEQFNNIKMQDEVRNRMKKYMVFNYVNPYEPVFDEYYSLLKDTSNNSYLDVHMISYPKVIDFSKFDGCSDFDLNFYKDRTIDNVEKIILPKGMKTINENLFVGFANVDYVVIPNSVTTIKAHALDEVTMIYLPKSVKEIDMNNIITSTIIVYEGNMAEFKAININSENESYPEDYYYEKLDSSKFYCKNNNDLKYNIIDGKILDKIYANCSILDMNKEFEGFDIPFDENLFKMNSKIRVLTLPSHSDITYNFNKDITVNEVIIPSTTNIKVKLESDHYVVYYVSQREAFTNFPKDWYKDGYVYWLDEWGVNEYGYPYSK